jgi:hypothetical protein
VLRKCNSWSTIDATSLFSTCVSFVGVCHAFTFKDTNACDFGELILPTSEISGGIFTCGGFRRARRIRGLAKKTAAKAPDITKPSIILHSGAFKYNYRSS